MASKKDRLVFARRLYVDGDSAKEIAKGADGGEKWVLIQARTAIPALISEQKWSIKDVSAHLGGDRMPMEMRKEAVRLCNEHGPKRAREMTGVSESTLCRWSSGKLGKSGVLTMGRRPWVRLEDPDPESDEESEPASEPETKARRGVMPKLSDKEIRGVVYAMLTGGDPTEIAEACGMSITRIYGWRVNLIGRTLAQDFAARAKKFVAEVAEELGVEAKPFVVSRINKPGSRKHASLATKEKAIHRLANEGVPIAEVAEEFGVPEQNIYAWRRQLLGKATDSQFGSKARALAKQFVTAARIDDQVNGQTAPDLMASASGMLTEVVSNGREVASMESLSAELEELSQMADSIEKDREILKLRIEVQQLRRQLSDR